jgi:hypothetical protein
MHRRVTWLCAVTFVFAVLATGNEGQAATVNAATCNSADVQAALNAATDGDTVVVPPGSCAWATTVTMNKAVKLQAGGGVTITNNIPGGFGFDLLALTESPNGHAELAGFNFVAGIGKGYTLRVKFATGGRAVLVHDNTWSGYCGGPACFGVRWETNRGVFWNNTITNAFPVPDNAFQLDPFSDSWLRPSTMGTNDTTGENNTYIEHNTFKNYYVQVLDLSAGSRNVVRYNTFINSVIASHGKETNALSHRHTEVYNNTFILDTGNGDLSPTGPYCTSNPPALRPVDWINLRGGTLVVTGNTMADIPMLCNYSGAMPAITLISHNLRRQYNNQTPQSGLIYNPCWGADSPPALQPNQVWPVPQQVGQGNDGTRVGDSFGSTNFVEPVYVWNNTGPLTVAPINFPAAECGTSRDVSEYIKLNRDYFLTAKPGYTPYPYPHPLTTSSATSVTSSPSPATTPAPAAPPPPSNLSIK